LAASFGTVLLAAGTYGQRYALPHATILMHQPLGGAQGQASEIEIQAHEILRLKTSLMEIPAEGVGIDILASNTGKTAEVIRHDTERDFFMNADQAVEYGLVDHVMTYPGRKNGKVRSEN
jgi:ATP-dependent Clp protease protease subunit